MLFEGFLEAILLVTALSADAFISSFAYGVKKIKIPFLSVIVIIVTCSTFLAASLFLGELIRPMLPVGAAKILCFSILFILGLTKLLDNALKTFIKKHNHLNKEIKFKLLNFHFILNVYANPEDADSDLSHVLAPAEAASLAVALSLDGLAAGIGTALGGANKLLIVTLSLISDFIFVTTGCFFGNRAAGKFKSGFSWLGGIGLIALAFYKLLM